MADPLPADTAGHVVNFQLVKEGRLEKIYVVKNDTIRTVKTRVSQALALGFDDPTAVTLVIDGKELSDKQVAARTGMFNHNAKVYTIIAEPRFTITVRTQDGVCFPLKVDRDHTIETVKKNIAIEAMAVFSGAKQLPSAATVAMSGLEAGDTLDVFFPFLLSTTVPLQVALPNGSLDVMEVDPTATVAETKQLILAKYSDLEGAYCLVYQSKKLPPTATLEECALLGAEVVVELEKAGQTGEEAAEAAQQVEQAADGAADTAPIAGGAPRRVDVDPLAGLAPVEFARTFSIQGILRSIDVSSRDTVVAVRRRIAAVLEISPHRVQLLFETRRISIEEDNDLFTEHCPGGESAIHVLIKPVAPKAATPGGAAAVDGFDDNAVSDAAVADEQAINIMFRATNGADLEGNGVVELAVTISETVGAVRARLAEALGIAAHRIVIVFEGKRMSDDKTLFFAHDVSAASVVSLLIQTSKAPKVAAAVAADAADVAETAAAEAEAASLAEGTEELSFRFSGHDIQSTSIKVLRTDTVAVVRQRLSADQKIPVSRLRLISEGKRLSDDTVIDSVDFTTASVIHVLVAREMGAGAEGAPAAAAAATAAGSAPSTSAARGNASAPAETGRHMALLFSFARSNLGLISCEVPWTFTVGQVKAKLAAENEALDRDRIALVFNGMRLADDVAVAACPIGTSSIINAYMTPEAEAEPGVPELGALPAPNRSVAIRAPDARRVNLAYHSDDTVAMAMERLGRILGYQGSNLKLMNEGVRCKADETVAEVGLTQVSMAFALVNNITLCDRLAVLAPDDVERSVNVRSDDTIASVAERICSVYQLPSPDQLEILEYDLNSGATLQELGLLGGASISVLHPRWAAVATVATDSHRDNLEGLATPDKTVAFSYDGGSFTLPINMMDTAPDVMRRVLVSGLMDEFCATHGGLSPVDDLQLVFAGRRIHSGRALQDCGVGASSVIAVVIKEVRAPGLELDTEVEIQTPQVETPRTAADRIGAALVRLSDENRNEFLSLPINTPIGTQTVWVHKNDTIDEVKYRIDEEITRSGQVLPGLLEDMILVSNGVTLTSGKTVSDYPISQGSAVHALFQVDFEESEPAAAVTTTLCFLTTSRDIVNIDVNANATANDVKKLVGVRVGKDPNNFVLFLGTKLITGNKPISEYEELSGMSTIQIVATGSS